MSDSASDRWSSASASPAIACGRAAHLGARAVHEDADRATSARTAELIRRAARAPAPQWDVRNPVGIGFAPVGIRCRRPAAAEHRISGPVVRALERPARARGLRADLRATGSRARGSRGRMTTNGSRIGCRCCRTISMIGTTNARPPDQQTPQFLAGGEPVGAGESYAGRSSCRFELPRVFLGFETVFLYRRSDGVMSKAQLAHCDHRAGRSACLARVAYGAAVSSAACYKLKKTRIVEKRVLAARR